MPTIHALFVAINEYPNPAHRLQGCIGDMEQVKNALQTCATTLGMGFKPLVLRDAEATRERVIAAFDYFSQAAPDDPCLFFYAGHGARSAAPQAFWHSEPDRKSDSIVCWDSRTPGGRDLMDKELSWLIWQANRNSQLPFITITDCCHSGSLRVIDLPNLNIRYLEETGKAQPVESYIGIKDYKRSANGDITPPQGRRIHLAASRDAETAKEVRIGADYRGIFSYFLVETLRRTGPFVTYTALLEQVQIQVRGNVTDQSPQLWATMSEDKNLAFLTHTDTVGKKPYWVGFDKNKGWLLDAGAIHGISAGTAEGKTLLEIPELKRIIELSEVYPATSKVIGMQDGDEKRPYAAFVIQNATPKFQVTFSADSDIAGIDAVKTFFAKNGSSLFNLIDDSAPYDFLIHIRDNAFWLTKVYDPNPLFQKVKWTGDAALRLFMDQVEKVATWRQRLNLNRAESSIAATEAEVELRRVTEPGNMENDAPVEIIDLQKTPVRFSYTQLNGRVYQPAFQCRIRNTGTRPLWFSLLYFGADYSISNALMAKEALAPGQEAWVSDVFEGYAYHTIPLRVDDTFLQQGIDNIEEYLKFFICTEELDTDLLCQQGVKSAIETDRTFETRKRITQRDWKCLTIPIEIFHII